MIQMSPQHDPEVQERIYRYRAILVVVSLTVAVLVLVKLGWWQLSLLIIIPQMIFAERIERWFLKMADRNQG